MKKFLIFFLLATFSFSSFSQSKSSSDVYVKSYTRSNGTVVKGYYRTAPNSTNRDNFSTRGNVNPYTGQPGYVKPDNKANTSTYSYSSSSNSSQINNSKTAIFKNGKWIIPSASEKNTFQDGTIKPKVKAALHFLKHHGEKVVITSIDNIKKALNQKSGTIIRN